MVVHHVAQAAQLRLDLKLRTMQISAQQSTAGSCLPVDLGEVRLDVEVEPGDGGGRVAVELAVEGERQRLGLPGVARQEERGQHHRLQGSQQYRSDQLITEPNLRTNTIHKQLFTIWLKPRQH